MDRWTQTDRSIDRCIESDREISRQWHFHTHTHVYVQPSILDGNAISTSLSLSIFISLAIFISLSLYLSLILYLSIYRPVYPFAIIYLFTCLSTDLSGRHTVSLGCRRFLKVWPLCLRALKTQQTSFATEARRLQIWLNTFSWKKKTEK